MIQEFNKIKLKNGDIGYISEKLDDTHFYADIAKTTGEMATVFITIDDIASVFVESERPISEYISVTATSY
jgi:hypothetical protein